jgi:steroid 5-alpha reductase family enzyme
MSFSTWPAALADVQRGLYEALRLELLPYREASALGVGLQLMLGAALLCWVASVLTHNYSHTDRVWSITPFVFAWHFAVRGFLEDGAWDARLVLMAALATLWGLRLSFNFWRKGGYSLSEEDYRWAVLRQHLHWTVYQLFNIVFIAGYQNLLLFLIVLPSYAVYLHRREAPPLDLAGLDGLAAALFLLLLALETAADQQQWVFYKAKYALIAAKQPLTGDYLAGFNRSGLFKYSRHPNFFAEQSIWWAFYLFSVVPTGAPLNLSVVGAALLSLLFQGSTVFTEYITAKKYPAYRDYQARVSALVPWFPRPATTKRD